MTTKLLRETLGGRTDGHRIGDQLAASALPFDGANFLGRHARRHDRDERQTDQAREVRLGHRGRPARGFDHGTFGAKPVVAECIQKERSREPVLQAAGRMARFVLQIQIDVREPGAGNANRCVSAERWKSASMRATASRTQSLDAAEATWAVRVTVVIRKGGSTRHAETEKLFRHAIKISRHPMTQEVTIDERKNRVGEELGASRDAVAQTSNPPPSATIDWPVV